MRSFYSGGSGAAYIFAQRQCLILGMRHKTGIWRGFSNHRIGLWDFGLSYKESIILTISSSNVKMDVETA